MANYKTLKKQLYATKPNTQTVTKIYNQSGMQDLTLNPVYHGPVYDPSAIVRKNVVRQSRYIRNQQQWQTEQERKRLARNNSLADVIWDMFTFEDDDIPLVTPWVEYGQSLLDAAWDEEEGLKFGNLMMTLLNGAIEDLDILANPMKGLVLDGWEGLKNATVGDEYGIRQNYYIDLNKKSWWDGPVNMALEFVLDPINWFTFGSAGALKHVIKGSADDFFNAIPKYIGDNIQDYLTNIKRLPAEEMGEVIRHAQAPETLERIAKITYKEAYKQIASGTTAKTYKEFIDIFSEEYVKNFIRGTKNLDDDFIRPIIQRVRKELFSATLEDTSMSVLKAIKGVHTAANVFDKSVFKTAAWNAGAMPVWLLTKRVTPAKAKAFIKRVGRSALVNTVGRGMDVLHNFKTRAEFFEYLSKNFNEDTSLRKVLEQLGEDPNLSSFDDILEYTIKEHTRQIVDQISQASKHIDLNTIDTLNTFIKSTYGYDTIDDLIANFKAIPQTVSEKTAPSMKKLTGAYNSLVHKVNVLRAQTKLAGYAQTGEQLLKLSDRLSQDSAESFWSSFSTQLQGIARAKKKTIGTEALRLQLKQELKQMFDEISTGLNKPAMDAVNTLFKELDEMVDDFVVRVESLSGSKKAALKNADQANAFIAKLFKEHVHLDAIDDLTARYAKYAETNRVLPFNSTSQKKNISKALRTAEKFSESMTEVLRVLDEDVAASTEVVKTKLQTIASTINTSDNIELIHSVIGDLQKDISLNRTAIEVLQEWQTQAPQLIEILQKDINVDSATELYELITRTQMTLNHLAPTETTTNAIKHITQLAETVDNKFVQDVADIMVKDRLYEIKTEQVYNVLSFIEDEEITEAMLLLATGHGNAKNPFAENILNLKQYIKMYDGKRAQLGNTEQYCLDAAKKLEALAIKYTAFVDLDATLQDMVQLGYIDDQMLNSIRSTLQRYGATNTGATLTCAQIADNFDTWFYDIFLEDVKMHHKEAFKRTESLGQATFFNAYKESGVLDKHGIKAERYTHTAREDAGITGVILKEELPEEFKLWATQRGLQQHRVVCIDIEANGLLDDTVWGRHHTQHIKASPEVYEIGTVTFKNTSLSGSPKSAQYLRQYGDDVTHNVPNTSVLNATGDPALTYREKVKAWTSAHNGFAEGVTEYYTRFLQDLLAEGDDIILVSHNGTAYDMRVLCHQFEQAGVDITLIERFKKIVDTQHYDNYVALQNKRGYVTFNDTVTKQLKEALSDYIDTSVLWNGYDDVAFDLGIRKFVDDTFLDKAYGDFAKDMQIPQALKDRITTKMTQLVNANNGVRYVLNVDAVKNLYLTSTGTFKTFSEVMSNKTSAEALEHLVRAYAPELGTDVFNEASYNALCKLLGNDPNLTTLLSRTNNSINYFGYRKVADVNKIRSWFDLSKVRGHSGDWSISDLKKLQDYAYRIENKTRNKNRLYNINEYNPETTLQRIKELKIKLASIDDKFATDPLYDIRLETNSNAELLAVEELYMGRLIKLVKDEKMLEDILKELPQQVFHDMANPTRAVRAILATYDGVEQALFDLQSRFTYLDNCDNFSSYSTALSKNKLFSAANLTQAKALDDTYAMVQEAKRLIQMYEHNSEDFTAFFERVCVYDTARILGENDTPEKLLYYMLSNKAPWIRIDYSTKGGYGLLFKDQINTMLARSQEYADTGIHFIQDDKTGFLYIVHDGSSKVDYYTAVDGYHMVREVDGVRVDEVIDYGNNKDWGLEDFLHDNEFENFDELIRLEKKVRAHNKVLTNGISVGHTNGVLSKATFSKAYAQLPDAVKQVLPPASELMKDSAWEWLPFDSIHLGSSKGRRVFGDADYITQLAESSINAIEHAKYTNLYADYIFNSDISLTELCTRLGKEDVYSMLLNHKDEYKLVVLTKQKHAKGQLLFNGQGYALQALNIVNHKTFDMALAKCPQAILVPTSVYSEMASELTNTLLQNNPVVKTLRGITYAYKIGLIQTVGKVFRDIFESQTKNLIETENVIAWAKGNLASPKVYHKYRKAMNDIMELGAINKQGYALMQKAGYSPDEFAEIYLRNRREAIEIVTRYYDNVNDIIKLDGNRIYNDVNKQLYFNSIASDAGISEELFDELHGLLFGHESFETVGIKLIDLSFKPMAYVDHINRVAEYLALKEITLKTPDEIAAQVMKTHFDASIKSTSERLVETVVPFYTFLKRNALYWARAAAEKPYIARIMGDYLSRSVGNLDSYTDFEKENNTSLQAALFNGAVAIGETESGDLLSLKINIPFMSAYSMYTQPLTYLAESTNPVVQYLAHRLIADNPSVPNSVAELLGTNRKYDFLETGENYTFNKSQLIPVVGPMLNKYLGEGYVDKQVAETGNKLLYLNSVFGRVKRFDMPKWATQAQKQPQSYKQSYSHKVDYTNTYSRRWIPTMSIPQYRYLTGGYGKTSFSDYYKSNSYRKYYAKNYTDYTYRPDTYRFYKKTYKQLQRERDYRNRVMYYKNVERQAQSNQRAWRVRQAAYNGMRLPKYMRTFGKTINYRP